MPSSVGGRAGEWAAGSLRVVVSLLGVALVAPSSAQAPVAAPGAASAAGVRLPSESQPFEANQGQAAPEHAFLSRGDGYEIRLGANASVLRLPALTRGPVGEGRGDPGQDCAVARLSYPGAEGARIEGVERLPGVVNYLVGQDRQGWLTGIPTYAAVRHAGIYPGVDLLVHGDHRALVYTWIVAPGADPGVIRVAVEGAEVVAAESRPGAVVLRVGGIELRLAPPEAHQESDGTPRARAAEFLIVDGDQLAFRIDGYDDELPLRLEVSLSRPSQTGAPDAEDEVRVATDDHGGVYVAGRSLACPDEPGEAFLARREEGTSTRDYTTYFGGEGEDVPLGIAVAPDGAVLLTGWTTSAAFPLLHPLNPRILGGRDAFVTQVAPGGSALVFSTYLGGEGDDEGRAIAADGAGGAWLTGRTTSLGLPATPDAVQPLPGGGADAFAARIAPGGSRLRYATYLGGNGDDEGNAIGLDPRDEVYLAGATRSIDFPTERPAQGTPGERTGSGEGDAFVAKLTSGGTRLAHATTLGGSGGESALSLVIDRSGAAHVAGWTTSDDFPAGRRALQPFRGGTAGRDAFVVTLAGDGASLPLATYLGGASDDRALGLAVDGRGDIWVAVSAQSGDLVPLPEETAGLMDGPGLFVAAIDAAEQTLRGGMRLGRGTAPGTAAIAMTPEGAAVVAGIDRSDATQTRRAVAAAYSGGVVFRKLIPGSAPAPEAAGCPGTIMFDNSAGTGLWQTATNWSTNVLPGPADDVCIGAGFSVTLSLGTQSINSLAVDAAASLTISAGSLSIAAASPLDGALTLSGGTLGGAGELTLGGPFIWTGGKMTGPGTTNANLGIAFSGTGAKDLDTARVLNTAGTTTWAGTGQVRLGNGSIINNSGTWDCQGDGTLSDALGGVTAFNNLGTGTFRKSAGGGTTTVIAPFHNAGGVSLESGTLNLADGGSHAGSFTGTAGTLRFGGGTQDLLGSSSVTAPLVTVTSGTVNVAGTYAVGAGTTLSGGVLNLDAVAASSAAFTLTAGTLGGTATLTVPGLLTWTGGSMTGAATTNADGGIAFSGTGPKDLDGARVLNTAGTTTWISTGQVRLGNGAAINNSGLWDCQGDATLSDALGGATAFNNTATGTFRKSAGGGATTVTAPFHNAGAVEAQSGTLSLNGGGSHTGTFTGSAGTLRFGGETHDLLSASSVTVPLVAVSGGIVNVGGAYTVATGTTLSAGRVNFDAPASTSGSFTFTSGTLAGTGTLTVPGLFAWSAGTMTAAGTTNADGGMAISGVGVKDLSAGRILNSAGTTTWTGTGQVRIGTGAVIHNSGVWDCQNDSSLSNSLGGAASFDNAATATFRKTAGPGTTSVAVPFDNAGAVSVESGTIVFQRDGTHVGSFAGSPGATLSFDGGVHSLTPLSTVSAAAVVFDGGTVSVSGLYGASGSTTVSGADVTFTPAATVSAVGSSLAISSGLLTLGSGEAIGATTLTFSGGTLAGTDTVTVAGPATWTSGLMTGAGTTNIDGGMAIGGVGVKDLTAGRILNTAGTTTWSGTGDVRMGTGAVIHNTGIWECQSDSSIINSLGGTATFDNAATATFRKSAGPGTTSVAVPFDNAGAVSVESGTLEFQRDGTHDGTFSAAPGATLMFGLGEHSLTSLSSVTAATVVFGGGTVAVSGTYGASGSTTVSGAAATFTPASTVSAIGSTLSISSGSLTLGSGEPILTTALVFSGGTLAGTDTLTVSGPTTWTAGGMTDAGTTNADGGITLSGVGVKDLSGARVLNTAGTTLWTGSGAVRMGTGAVIHNLGVWDCQNDSTITNSFGGITAFENAAAGTFRKSGGAGTTTVLVPFANAGGLEALAGTIAFSGGLTQTAGETTLAGGTISSMSTIDLQGGSLSGVGTVSASIASGGQFAPGLSPGLLVVSGDYVQSSSGTFTVELGGAAAGTGHDQLAVGGTATLAGTLDVSLVNGFVPPDGTEFTVLAAASRSGTFTVENLPPLPAGGTWEITYGPASVVLTAILDADGDGVTNSLDCAPLDPGAFAIPAQVAGDAVAADAQTYSWTSAALTAGVDTIHDVVRGALNQLPVGGGAAEVCLASDLAAASLVDTTAPASRQGLYYLVRGRNVCGAGSFGFASSGAERIPTDCP